ncbi:MAG TPA: N(G),N(G)-dimethylarginine dimethylaminohydrolase [Sphingomicrobium sp.]|jgi:dimethylargininase|nr:N(G),N(G)-dimethylarginine dimethylaminohydrolase [Sphingomicrobium sp.]
MPLAFTRAVSPRIVDCALTHLDRRKIDPDLAATQHAAYEKALKNAGYDVIRLPELADDPDAVFVEDTALLLGEHAIITRPGAASRANEIYSTAIGLTPHFHVHYLPAGTLDGGDVLRVENTLYVGQSSRTDMAGTQSLEALVTPLGYWVVPVELDECLHLKTAVTFAGLNDQGVPTVLVNPDWVDPDYFSGTEALFVPAEEPFAANVVQAGDRLIMAAGSPQTAALLRKYGFKVIEVELSELQKAEAGGTCMSLLSD